MADLKKCATGHAVNDALLNRVVAAVDGMDGALRDRAFALIGQARLTYGYCADGCLNQADAGSGGTLDRRPRGTVSDHSTSARSVRLRIRMRESGG
jgi:hypothetical protein